MRRNEHRTGGLPPGGHKRLKAKQMISFGVELRCDAERICLEADPERLKQVLFNLLDNVLRHAPAGGWVKLELKREAGAAMLARQR